MKWPRYDTMKSTDNRNMDLKETCFGDVMKMLHVRSKEEFWKDWAERHEYRNLKEGMWTEPAKNSSNNNVCWT